MATNKHPAPPTLLDQWADIVREYGVRPMHHTTGVSWTTLHKSLRGVRSPSLDTLTRTLAAAGYRLVIVPATPADSD